MTEQETIGGGKYIVGPKIGSGSFGEIFLVNEVGTNELFALKKEDQKSKHPTLQLQGKILKNLEGQNGFLKVYWQGIQSKANLIVIDLLGPSLDDLHALCGRKFSLKTTLMLGDQMLQRIQYLHSKNFIHRDIKPQNFLMGLKRQSHIAYLIDFGLSKRYRDSKNHQHIPYKENKNLTGTARYASINSHLGIEQSRRDDLEAIGYVLLYFYSGYLPWQGLRANNKIEKYQKIMEKKMSLPVEVQCKGLPVQFSIYLNYCRSLKFNEKPDYYFMKRLFRGVMERERISYDFDYDWCHLETDKNYNNGKLSLEIRPKETKFVEEEDQKEEVQKAEEGQKMEEKLQEKSIEEHIQQPDELVEPEDEIQVKQTEKQEQDMLLEGEENIEDSDIFEEPYSQKLEADFEIDMEEKKNKLIYEE